MGMINLDMIGRAKGRVLVGGPERVPWAELIVRDLQQFTPLQLRDFREGYGDGASDDAPFVRAGVPAVTFFTGFHDDYHRPTDDWERIDVNGATEIAKVALALVERISSTRR
jgi:Zn-dependent M28 family amino/carboxypeptidase